MTKHRTSVTRHKTAGDSCQIAVTPPRRNIVITDPNQAQSEHKHSLTFRVRRCCHSNETRAPIANSPNNAQLEGTPTISPTLYIRVRAVVWECGEGQTDRQTHRRP